jgi:hypothetical protein
MNFCIILLVIILLAQYSQPVDTSMLATSNESKKNSSFFLSMISYIDLSAKERSIYVYLYMKFFGVTTIIVEMFTLTTCGGKKDYF